MDRENEYLKLKDKEACMTAEIVKLNQKLSDLSTRLLGINPDTSSLAKKFCYMATGWVHRYTDGKCYDFMRNNLMLNLPHVKTLSMLRHIPYVKPGIQSSVLDNLKQVTSSF